MWSTNQRYSCLATSAGDARRFATDELRGYLGSTEDAVDVVDTAQLIVSELITNAVNAECSSTELRLSCEGRSLRIAVLDDGGGRPSIRAAGDRDEHGRGLAIIDSLATDWGVVDDSEAGKQVWVEVALPPRLLAS
jgi:anti-sigma regulatory factor (Ser/Thr protein kinase)